MVSDAVMNSYLGLLFKGYKNRAIEESTKPIVFVKILTDSHSAALSAVNSNNTYHNYTSHNNDNSKDNNNNDNDDKT